MIEQAALERAYTAAREALLTERCADGYWVGELASSPLATATAVSALSLAARRTESASPGSGAVRDRNSAAAWAPQELSGLIAGGLRWLAAHQNPDGGWGDTPSSRSNISTTMLVRAAFHLAGAAEQHTGILDRASKYIDRVGGTVAVVARYGADRTFAVPILTNCALAGQVTWSEIAPLPFELACLPHAWFRFLRLNVVSYALPALIAIGLLLHARRPTRNLLVRWIRHLATDRALGKLEAIQPASGGFLEAVPLTSFVTMSLLALDRSDLAVTRKALRFIVESVRRDGSWPIDSNLSVWVTTLSVGALSIFEPDWSAGTHRGTRTSGPSASSCDWSATRQWLLECQFREIHSYTNAAPGGWCWTHLPGGVPDADDTAGALLALRRLPRPELSASAVMAGIRWLLAMQNRDGGWPTFCRGWGKLPFDRSSPDLTAHALRALAAWQSWLDRFPPLIRGGKGGSEQAESAPARHSTRIDHAVSRGLAYLRRAVRQDGAWVPLWFGNQHAPNEENPTYGTARVLAAYRDLGQRGCEEARRGVAWLCGAQNDDGGWGGAPVVASSVEETALAVEALAAPWPDPAAQAAREQGIVWLLKRVRSESWRNPSPIGLYFAKLWYFEKLYPQIFTVAALSRARQVMASLNKPTSALA